MPRLPITWVEVFAEAPLRGTLLPVLHDADGVPDEVLGLVARRFFQPETSFLQRPTEATATYRHRIFTIASELPFAGHPSLGAAAAHAWRGGATRAEYVQQTPSGLQRLRVELDGDVGRAEIAQNPPVFGPTGDPGPLLAALGIDPSERHPELRPQLVSTGLPTVVVPVGSVAAVAAARFDAGPLGDALRPYGASGTMNCYVVAEVGPGHWRARAFGLDLPGGEDPATGSAAGPLGAYLRTYSGLDGLVIDQGVEMGARSRLEVRTSDGIVVGGGVRITGAGTHDLPDSVAPSSAPGG